MLVSHDQIAFSAFICSGLLATTNKNGKWSGHMRLSPCMYSYIHVYACSILGTDNHLAIAKDVVIN